MTSDLHTHAATRLRWSPRAVLFVALTCAAIGVNAQAATTPPQVNLPEGASNDRASIAPMVRHQGDVAYVSGGIGDDGQARTKALGRDMNLQMVFAQRNGNYLAQVDVEVADKRGNTVLDVDSSGPLLYAQLPPGRYEVTATLPQGRTIERNVDVPAQGRHTERFLWSDSNAQGK
ncbi:MAG: hypothetical protein LT102_00040 [Burkholderiaceae bacterium]|nr:hypothetical protein [Burkholderiaceae bacterium]